MNKRIFSLAVVGVFLLLGCSSTNKNTSKAQKANVSKNSVSNKEQNMSTEKKEAQYMMLRGLNLIDKGKRKEGMKNLKNSYEIDPENPITVRSIGLLYSKLGDSESGKKYLEETLLLDEYDSVALYNLGVIYYKEQNYPKAVQYLTKIKIEDVDEKVRLAKAYSYYKNKDYEKSREVFNNMDLIDGKYDISFYETYTEVLEKTGNMGNVYPMIYKVYEKNKKKESYVIMFARYLKTMGVYDEALEILKKYASTTDIISKNIVLEICDVALRAEKYGEASVYLDLIDPKAKYDQEVLEMKLKYYEKVGKEEEAEKIDKIQGKSSKSSEQKNP